MDLSIYDFVSKLNLQRSDECFLLQWELVGALDWAVALRIEVCHDHFDVCKSSLKDSVHLYFFQRCQTPAAYTIRSASIHEALLHTWWSLQLNGTGKGLIKQRIRS